jgi:hypothetical protein
MSEVSGAIRRRNMDRRPKSAAAASTASRDLRCPFALDGECTVPALWSGLQYVARRSSGARGQL